jgi:ribosome biogenesis GTPase
MSKKWDKRSWENEDRSDRFERVGKMKRRHKTAAGASALEDTFEVAEGDWPSKFPDGFAARVVEVHKRYAFVSKEIQVGEVDTSDVWLATIARKFLTAKREGRNFVCVGDRVLCVPTNEKDKTTKSDLPQCVIQHLSPRRTKIARRDPSLDGREHILATNIDQVMIVASYLSPKVRWGLIDRYLTIAEWEGVEPIIVLNKRDLLGSEATPAFRDECTAMVALYRKIGYPVLSIQANAPKAMKDPEVQALQSMLKGKITGFSGHSGVGKSSIINLFKPELVQVVEEDSDIFYKGRHTTTFASFIKLGTGGYVIDTPGIRSFPINTFEAIDLTHCYREMRPWLGKCKFRECRHIDEPECKIKDAMERGEISEWRYKSYLGILLGETGREGRVREELHDTELSDDDN